MFFPSVTSSDQWRIRTTNPFQYNSNLFLLCWVASAILSLGGGDLFWAKEVLFSQQGKTSTTDFDNSKQLLLALLSSHFLKTLICPMNIYNFTN